jgi:SAM-dependent methyltransferase
VQERDDAFEATRRAWRVHSRVARYASLQGWIDVAERQGVLDVADEVRGEAVLDLGVGGGRTTSLLGLLSSDYLGLDSSPEMVAASRATHPGMTIREGDARDLSFVASGSIKFVFFSYNGIDYVDHSDRLQIYAEIARVLQSGGVFAYSTLAREGSVFGEKPWHLRKAGPDGSRLRALAALALRLPATFPEYPARYAAWLRNRHSSEDHESWAVLPAAHADFGLVHFTTVGAELQQLTDVGLKALMVRCSDGCEVTDDGATTVTPWYFIVARKMLT